MKKSYNHDLFIENLFEIDSKEVQFQMFKKYVLSLPIEEFDNFFLDNITKIQHGIAELSESGELTKADLQDLLVFFDDAIEMTQSLQHPLIAQAA